MTLETGSHVGRIRIEALLGSGGMGDVYRGWDEKLERAVALKVVHGEKRLSAAVRTRFLREARMLSRLDHPNISRIYDVVEREDGDYLVLELVEGRTLRNLLQQPLARAQALDIALQVARVLTATHARDIIHRDLKPENVMLTPEGQVKVLDFGLARSIDAAPEGEAIDASSDDYTKTAVLSELATTNPTHTFAGSIVGTLQYMSPEQARGIPLNEPSDLYSLGVVLLEMLLGTHQIYGAVESPHDLLARVRRAEIAPFDTGDAALDGLVKRMLALYPADRPTAEDVVRELDAILTRPARIRRRVITAASAAAIVLAVAGAFFASRRLSETPGLFGERRSGRIAILPFRNATGDPSLQWIELGLATFVHEGVSRARGAEIAEMDDVRRTMDNLRLRDRAQLSKAERGRLLAALGADVLIAPTVVSSEGKYTIRYAALTADDEQKEREATSTVLVEAAKQMSVQLAQRIDPAASASAVRARYSLDNIANMLYAIGTEEFRARGPRIAAHYFTVCVDRDSDFVAAKLMLAESSKRMADNERAHRLLAEALSRARERGDRELVARVLIRRGSWQNDAGDKSAAERDANEALGIGRAINARDVVRDALDVLGYAAWRRGDLDRGKALFQQALRLAVESRDPVSQARLYDNIGRIDTSARRSEDARVMYERALEITERTSDRFTGATVIGHLANMYATKRDFAGAEATTRRQLALTRETGDAGLEIFALANLGLYLWAQGKEAEAIVVTEEAAAVAAKVRNPRVEALILSNLAHAYTKLGDLERARRYNEAAFAKFGTLDDPELERDLQLSLAYTLIRMRKLKEAAEAIARAEKWQVDGRCVTMRARLAYGRGEYGLALAQMKRAKTMDDDWFVQYEQMLRAFEESARTGKPSTIDFEGPVT